MPITGLRGAAQILHAELVSLLEQAGHRFPEPVVARALSK